MTHESEANPDALDPSAPPDAAASPPGVDVTVVIPAYNEEQGIGATLDGLLEVTNASRRCYEVIVVDDGSSDATAEAATRDDVRLLRHRSNKGYGAALKTGVLAAAGEIVCFYDADAQFHPRDVERLVDEMDHVDAALGSRTAESYVPLSRAGGKRLLASFANYLARQEIPDLNCGLRAIKREILLDYLHLLPQGFSASSTTTLVLLKEGYEVVFVPITVEKRVGTSTVRPFKHGMEVALLVLRLTTLFDPFRVFGPVALLLFLAGVGWGAQYMIQGQGLSVAALFLLISAVLIFFFGLLTDQVAALRRERRYSDWKR
jgi:glycosyltransferase involved in cell wall biosynthesis